MFGYLKRKREKALKLAEIEGNLLGLQVLINSVLARLDPPARKEIIAELKREVGRGLKSEAPWLGTEAERNAYKSSFSSTLQNVIAMNDDAAKK